MIQPGCSEGLDAVSFFLCKTYSSTSHVQRQQHQSEVRHAGSPYLQHRVATLLVQHGRRHQNHPTSLVVFGCVCLTGPHAFGPKCFYFGHKIVMKQPHDCSYWPMGGRPNGAFCFIKENREKTEEPSLGTSDNGATTAPWQLCKVHT